MEKASMYERVIRENSDGSFEEIKVLEPAMSYEDQLACLKIAHEATDPVLRNMALRVLEAALNPKMMVMPDVS